MGSNNTGYYLTVPLTNYICVCGEVGVGMCAHVMCVQVHVCVGVTGISSQRGYTLVADDDHV